MNLSRTMLKSGCLIMKVHVHYTYDIITQYIQKKILESF